MDELGIDYLDRRAGLINAVTLDDVRRVAKRLLDAPHLSGVVVGDPQGVVTFGPPGGACYGAPLEVLRGPEDFDQKKRECGLRHDRIEPAGLPASVSSLDGRLTVMGMLKALTKTDSIRHVLCWLAAQYIRLVFHHGPLGCGGRRCADGILSQGKPFILAFWHGRILMMPYCWRRGQPINMLISQHRDGQIIARTVSHFNIDTIVGSSSKGGSVALRTMVKALKNGQCVGITPDGPRGPRMRASDGIVQVARLSGAPVIACSFSIRRRKVLGSWDRFVVALPFSHGVFVWGRPIDVPGMPRRRPC